MSSQIDPVRLAELVKKYDCPGPRYTSYPTVPEWSNQYGPEDYKAAIKEASSDVDEPLSFYLHIPFCRKRCWFCGCTTMISRTPEAADAYLGRVEKESKMVAELLGRRKRVSQFHWGGGTPSFLTEAQTIRAFEIFSANFEIMKGAEISIELDPRVTTKERIKLLKSLGFNRLSFGIQDFNHEVQEAIGRNQDETQSIELYRHCRQEGFTGINFDLIYGLPRQTVAGFQETLRKVIELRPDRVALYSFAHLPEGRANQQKIDIASLPTPQVKSDLFNLARETFVGNGYFQIGMDHFVLPGDELAVAASKGKLRRNFMGYTVNAAKDWVGIGMSSISYIRNNFAQNQSGINSYNSAIDENRFAAYRGMKLSEDDLIRQHIISELMCNFRLDTLELKTKFGIVPAEYLAEELQQLQPFLDDGLLNWDEKVLTVAPAGRLFVRNIAMTFDAYLKNNQPEKSKVKFSRTI
ncbi:MAG: oxygen-independent coproporphyrinogen III oxidase [candidate division Zixibacteria bacterium]|nr:oxygen-independent coproporphyrinogen III oxidase [candidate division Zixibacteria bacterium]